MMNTSLFEKMISRYNELSYTHNYIYGFYFQNNVYMVEATAEVMPYILKLDKASRGAGYSLRFGPDSSKRHPVAQVYRVDGSLFPQGPGGRPVSLLRGP